MIHYNKNNNVKITQKAKYQHLCRAICCGLMLATAFVPGHGLTATVQNEPVYADQIFADGDSIKVGGENDAYQAISNTGADVMTLTLNGSLAVGIDNTTTDNKRNTSGIYTDQDKTLVMDGNVFTVTAKGNVWTTGINNWLGTMALGKKDDGVKGKISLTAESLGEEADAICNAGTTDFYEQAELKAIANNGAALGIWQSSGDLTFHEGAAIEAAGSGNTYAIRNGNSNGSGTITFANGGDSPITLQAHSVNKEAMGIFNFGTINFARSVKITVSNDSTTVDGNGYTWETWGVVWQQRRNNDI